MIEKMLHSLKKTPEISPTFCVYPWMELNIGPTEHIKICCIADKAVEDEKGRTYTFEEDSLEDYWNGYGLKKIREKMLSGEKIKACKTCYFQESIGRTSYRQSFNEQWFKSASGADILNRVEKSKVNGFRVERPPIYLDIRPGNLCNLKCRMCNPGSSSKIYKEQKQLLEEKPSEMSPLIETGYFSRDEKKFHNWYKNEKMWRNIYKWAPGTKQLYFTGGEPTLIKENWELIDYLIQKGYSKNIHLIFNLNCTQAPEKLLNTFSAFSSVNIAFSIDGYEKTQEYIRYPSKWGEIKTNILKILKNRRSNTQFHFSPVVQVYNILNLTELLRWIDELQVSYGNIENSMIICTRPEFLNVAILPKNIKQEALLRIEEYEQSYKGNDHCLLEYLGAVKNLLKTEENDETEKDLKNFYKYTYLLDQKRGNSFKETFPELYHFFEEDGRWNN